MWSFTSMTGVQFSTTTCGRHICLQMEQELVDCLSVSGWWERRKTKRVWERFSNSISSTKMLAESRSPADALNVVSDTFLILN